jgi:hypothetical protein
MICKPNDWAKAVKSSVESSELTDTKIKQLEFWDAFKNFAKQNNTTLRFQKSYPQHWTNISIGSSDCNISLTINSKDNTIGCELYIPDNKELFQSLFEKKEQIENSLSEKLEWMELSQKKASRIKLATNLVFSNETEWENAFEWMKEKAEKFQTVFPKYFLLK